MAYRTNTGNHHYKDGYLSNKYHGVCRRSGFQNHYSDNFNYGYNYNSSQQEDDEPSVKELLKSFIHTEAKMNEDLEDQFEVWENHLMELNDKFDQSTISFEAWLQVTELKFDQMEERISNELTGQPIQNTQQNPITHDKFSWFCEEDYYSEDEDKISPKFYESGLDVGRNEQQNPLRCSEVSICSTWDSQYPSASQSSHEESEGVVEYCLKNYPEAKIEEPKRVEKIIEMKTYTVEIESEYEDSDDEDWFEELNELIIKENVEEDELESGLNELETVSPKKVEVEFDPDDELQESVEEVEGEGVEWLDINVNKKYENLKECEAEKKDIEGMTKEEFGKWLDNELDGLETVSPIEVYEEFDFEEDMEFFEALDRGLGRRMEEELEVKNKPPELTEPKLQGMYDFIDKLVSLLSCRSDGIFGKVVASSHRRFHKKKCKNICIYFDYLRTLDIFVDTKKWMDAMVQNFEKVLVSNEFCDFKVGFCLNDFYYGLT